MEKLFVVIHCFSQTFKMIHYLVYIQGKIAPTVFILLFVKQNGQCHFMGRAGYGPEFRRCYGYGFVVMSMGWSRS